MNSNNKPIWKKLLNLVCVLSGTAYEIIKLKLLALWKLPMSRRNQVLRWNPDQIKRVEERVRRQIREREHPHYAYERDITSKRKHLSRDEREMVRYIERAVRNMNRSNITRTAAYARMYNTYPELHWALLAHMVSRNGGWGMTDLQGSLFPSLMTGEHRLWTYRMLERCNALIFQDAYPQLMLYSASKRHGRSLFHLLPLFHVSSFMTPFWESYWIQPNSPMLTIALIINEQHVIEGRVVQHADYIRHVIGRKDFSMHGWLQMNQVFFPVGRPLQTEPMALYGLTLERFDSLKERIAFGKRLYALLFDVPEVHAGVLQFMRAVTHTGSRDNYWPHRFSHVRSKSHELGKLYSPKLVDAWQDMQHAPIEPQDWLRHDHVLQELHLPTAPRAANITKLHEQMWLEHESLVQLHNDITSSSPSPYA